jgi:DNA-binding LytR/AlgR family response regulator
MKILIIEDEPQAAQRLESLLGSIVPQADVIGKIDTVKNAVTWLKSNPAPDVVLMDIQLADGISFQIFDQCEVSSPVIFTTAYDEYAIRAFKVNSVDYILKPVDKEELAGALKKVVNSKRSGAEMEHLVKTMSEAIKKLTRNYKSRFVIKVGEHLKTIEVNHIKYFYSQEKITFGVTDENRNFILDHTLEQLEEMLDPGRFYRVNRKYLVSSEAIQDIIHYTNSRLKLVLKGSTDNDIIVARERVQEFKEWLNR